MPGNNAEEHPDCQTLRGRAHQVRDETNAAFHAVEAARFQLRRTQDMKRRVSADLSEVLKELGAAGIPTGIPASKISGLVGLVVSVTQGVLLVRKHDRLKKQLQSLTAEEIRRVRRVTNAEARQQDLRKLEMEIGNRLKARRCNQPPHHRFFTSSAKPKSRSTSSTEPSSSPTRPEKSPKVWWVSERMRPRLV